MLSNTIKYSEAQLEKIRLILVTRFQVVWALYPYYRLSQTELAEKIDIDQGNLSRLLSELIKKGLLLSEKGKSKGGKPPNLISLSKETRQVLDQNIQFLIKDEQGYKEIQKNTEEKLLELLSEEGTRTSTADELQKLSRQFKLSPKSDFLGKLVELVPCEKYGKVRHVILLSIQNFVQGVEEDQREEVIETIYEPLRKTLEQDDEPLDDRSEQIIHQIFDFLKLFPLTYELLRQELDDSISKLQYQESHLRAEQIVKCFPDRIPEFRLSLIETYGPIEGEEKNIMESILEVIPLG